MFNQLNNINGVKHLFDTNNHLYFACLYPKYEWFYKRFSISKIITPTKVKIVKTSLLASTIEKDDRFFLSKQKFNKVVRKYNLHVYLNNGEKFIIEVYENIEKKILTRHEKNLFVGLDFNDVQASFYKSIIRMKVSLDKDKTTNIEDDDNFKMFKTLYKTIIDNYPEEVIK